MKFLENIKEVIEVFCSNIFYSKVINNEAELDGTPFVAPEARGGFHLIVTFNKKAGSEKIIGQDAGLGQTIATLANFEVPASLYSSMNSAGISAILMRTYSGSGIGVSR